MLGLGAGANRNRHGERQSDDGHRQARYHVRPQLAPAVALPHHRDELGGEHIAQAAFGRLRACVSVVGHVIHNATQALAVRTRRLSPAGD